MWLLTVEMRRVDISEQFPETWSKRKVDDWSLLIRIESGDGHHSCNLNKENLL
jgi:hypothetical protein